MMDTSTWTTAATVAASTVDEFSFVERGGLLPRRWPLALWTNSRSSSGSRLTRGVWSPDRNEAEREGPTAVPQLGTFHVVQEWQQEQARAQSVALDARRAACHRRKHCPQAVPHPVAPMHAPLERVAQEAAALF